MKKVVFWLTIIGMVGIMGIGCSGTVKGVKQDVGNAFSSTGNAIKN